jgi:putative spermidine/putrescine transport system substrate-binding protein
MCMVAISACGGSDDDSTGSTTSTGNSDLSGTITWYETAGGEVEQARATITFPQFEEATGVKARGEYNADSTKFMAGAENGNVSWDVIEFPSVGDFIAAQEAGFLAPIDPEVVPVDELDPSASDKYGIKGERYGINIVWNTNTWPADGEHPESLADIYDTERFPGKRCMYGYPAFGATLESALLADGVSLDELYPLDTKRAYAKLDEIKNDIVWYERDLVKLMLSGECDIAIGWSGQIRNAVEKDGAPLAIGWDDTLYAEAVFAVPKDAPNPEAGQAALAFMVENKDAQLEFVEATGYPTAIEGISYGPELAEWMPLGENIANAIPEDAVYYSKHLSALSDEFFEWSGS